jgi:glycosyltransferase 2 family protein
VPGRRWWVWLAQLGVAGLVVWLVWPPLAANWAEFKALDVDLTVGPGWLALSVAAVFATYALQVESWRRILRGWGQVLPYNRAVRAWWLANIGRYLPGKVWSVAGMVVLAQRDGVAGWAAAASTVVVQAVGIGTGVAVVVAAAPEGASPLHLAAAAGAAVGTLALLTWEPFTRRVARLASVAADLRPLPVKAVGVGAGLTLTSWLTYGLAFWFLARGLLGDAMALPMLTAAGVFALGYILGWVALFAPGGVGVREVVLVGLLTAHLGTGGAVAVSIGSRILLTLTEAAAALAALAMTGRKKENLGEPTRS